MVHATAVPNHLEVYRSYCKTWNVWNTGMKQVHSIGGLIGTTISDFQTYQKQRNSFIENEQIECTICTEWLSEWLIRLLSGGMSTTVNMTSSAMQMFFGCVRRLPCWVSHTVYEQKNPLDSGHKNPKIMKFTGSAKILVTLCSLKLYGCDKRSKSLANSISQDRTRKPSRRGNAAVTLQHSEKGKLRLTALAKGHVYTYVVP